MCQCCRYQKYAWALKFISWGYRVTFFETGYLYTLTVTAKSNAALLTFNGLATQLGDCDYTFAFARALIMVVLECQSTKLLLSTLCELCLVQICILWMTHCRTATPIMIWKASLTGARPACQLQRWVGFGPGMTSSLSASSKVRIGCSKYDKKA